MAAARSLRDVRTQIWLADDELLSGNYLQAFERIDALLRVWPDLGETLFPVLADLALQPDSSDALVSALQENPPWRRSFLAMLPTSREEPSELTPFYDRLSAAASPLTTEELRSYLQALIDTDAIQLAYSVWTQSLAPEARPTSGEVYNGDFELPVEGLPFDWNFREVRGATINVAPNWGGSRALRVEFHNTRVPFRHVFQLTLLEPGSYRLTGSVRTDSLQNERGLQWIVICGTGDQEKLGETNLLKGTGPWRDFETLFSVPNRDDCRTQLLRLELAARIPAEQKVSGEAWFDDIAIEPSSIARF